MKRMIYDGTGSSVHIPTLLISQQDGDVIKTLFHDRPDVRLQVKVDLDNSEIKKKAVTYELFYGSLLDLPAALILDLYEY